MCAPLMLGGLQVAASLAGAAAQAQDQRRQARLEADAARADAALSNARAEFARDDAERNSAAARARTLAGGVHPQSASVVSTLAAAHAERLDPAAILGGEAARTLHQAGIRSRLLRAQRGQLMARSLLGVAQDLAQLGPGFRVPR